MATAPIFPRSRPRRPPLHLFLREAPALWLRVHAMLGKPGERGPEDGRKAIVVPGFLASDHTTLPLRKALAAAGYRVAGWDLGLNRGVRADTLEHLADRIRAFGSDEPVLLVGWSLGGLFAREVAKAEPGLVRRVVTMGSPFSGDPRANNAWRLYEWVAGHPVDSPPIDAVLGEKPPVPTLALWSRRDGIVAPEASCGANHESDARREIGCSHMGFALSGRFMPAIVAAIREFDSD